MTDDNYPATGQQAPLGDLLAQAVSGVVQAQRVLDEDAQSRVHAYFETPQGETVLPPLWFTFGEVKLELEMASAVARKGKATARGTTGIDAARPEVQLQARLINPAAVSLFGYAAASGLRVTMILQPHAMPADGSLPAAMGLPPVS